MDHIDDRKRSSDALADFFDTNISPEKKRLFPKNDKFVKDIALGFDPHHKKYVSCHDNLSKNVQDEIIAFANDAQEEIELEALQHFASEKAFLGRLNQMSADDFFDNIKIIEEKYNELDSVTDHFNMQRYRTSFENEIKTLPQNDKKDDNIALSKESHFQALIKALTVSFNTRKAAYEQILIDEKRKQFLQELYEKIENFRELEKLLQPFINDLAHGYLWDLSKSSFRNLGFDILNKYASLLNNDKVLQEFAELLGTQSVTSKEVEKKIIEETVVKSAYHPKAAQSGNLVGFEYSNEISKVLPSETALLNDPELENLFYLKFIEKQLLSYRYSQNETAIQEKEIESSKSKDITGPIIICVDTSGSMRGTPETTAKLATFAIAKIAMRQKRKCYLISFSTEIETFDMSLFKKANALESLVNFLNKSFNGGTDALPALSECLRKLSSEDYQNADVLMISDFVMKSLPENIVSAIHAEQENGTYFYSLVIGNSANNKAIECFNENIYYNPYDEQSRKEFYEKIRKIACETKKSRGMQ